MTVYWELFYKCPLHFLIDWLIPFDKEAADRLLLVEAFRYHFEATRNTIKIPKHQKYKKEAPSASEDRPKKYKLYVIVQNSIEQHTTLHKKQGQCACFLYTLQFRVNFAEMIAPPYLMVRMSAGANTKSFKQETMSTTSNLFCIRSTVSHSFN